MDHTMAESMHLERRFYIRQYISCGVCFFGFSSEESERASCLHFRFSWEVTAITSISSRPTVSKRFQKTESNKYPENMTSVV